MSTQSNRDIKQDIQDTMDYYKVIFILEAMEIDPTNKSASLKEITHNNECRMESIYKLYVYPAAMYREYLNNFLTLERFAEYYGLSQSVALDLINFGRDTHESFVSKLAALIKK